MKKRAILSAGGTGGHLFPAQALAQQLPDWELLFVAGGLKTSRYFDQTRFAFEEIPCATFSLSQPVKALKGSFIIWQGIQKSRHILKSFCPEVVIGFGSFFTLPMLAAALFEKIPFILHEQNSFPGKVNRLFSPYALANALTFPSTRNYLKPKALKKSVEVLFPTRQKPVCTKEQSFHYFGLAPGRPTLLVFGGSQGAQRLNSLFLESAALLGDVQVLHFTGNQERAQEASRHYADRGITACVKPFENAMERAMQIADVAITRAGSATVNELIESNLPALLIPFPFATENHQEKNAEHFVIEVGGGKMYKESALNAALLADLVLNTLAHRDELRTNIAQYKTRRNSTQLADLIEEKIHGRN